MPLTSNPSNNKDLSTKGKITPILRARALLSKGNLEEGNTSFRVYYGANGATIPFIWESQPGTPKHPIFNKNDNIVPPLTPPPSYILRASNNDPFKIERKHMVFRGFFSSIIRKSCSHVSPTSLLSSSNSYSSPSSSESTTSSLSTRSSPRVNKKCSNKQSHKRSFSFSSLMEEFSIFDKEEDEVQNDVEFSTYSSMCFGFKNKSEGCYSMQNMKNALFSSK